MLEQLNICVGKNNNLNLNLILYIKVISKYIVF